jgi:hypothetical protein
MNVGMLWFDNDKKTALNAKVERAADYYRQKYGLVPDLCLVHPSMLIEPKAEMVEGHTGKVALRTNRAILPGHLWIGVEEKN